MKNNNKKNMQGLFQDFTLCDNNSHNGIFHACGVIKNKEWSAF